MSEIIPFGKYKGQPIEAMTGDREYVKWLQGQSWFLDRYQNINAIIINNFREPAETPEHNNIQAAFTDEEFCKRFIDHLIIIGHGISEGATQGNDERWIKYRLLPEEIVKASDFKQIFEKDGIDVKLKWNWYYKNGSNHYHEASIEIKPILTDDYPAVLRQMMANKSTYLFTRAYTGSGATLDQVRKIFESADKYIVIESDLE